MFDLTNVHKLMGVVYPTTRISATARKITWMLGTKNTIMCRIEVNQKRQNTLDFAAWFARTGSNIYTANVNFTTDASHVAHPEIVGIVHRRIVSFAPMPFDSTWAAEMPIRLNCTMFAVVCTAVRLAAATHASQSPYTKFASSDTQRDGCNWHLEGTNMPTQIVSIVYGKTTVHIRNATNNNAASVNLGGGVVYCTQTQLFTGIVNSEMVSFLRQMWRTLVLLTAL